MKLYTERSTWTTSGSVRESALGARLLCPANPTPGPVGRILPSPPEKLGGYLRELRELFAKYRLHDARLYGHFGQACIHCRIDFDLTTDAGNPEIPLVHGRGHRSLREVRRQP